MLWLLKLMQQCQAATAAQHDHNRYIVNGVLMDALGGHINFGNHIASVLTLKPPKPKMIMRCTAKIVCKIRINTCSSNCAHNGYRLG